MNPPDVNPESPPAVSESSVIGGSAWEGFRAVFRSPYLLGIAFYVLTLAIVATFIYFTRLQWWPRSATQWTCARDFAKIDPIPRSPRCSCSWSWPGTSYEEAGRVRGWRCCP